MKYIYTVLIHFIFAIFYGYAFFVFYKLNENSCECEKLEGFKKENSFLFLFYSSFLFLMYNFVSLFKAFQKSMKGGSNVNNIYYRFIIIISIGYAFAFLFDYILLKFFSKMKQQKCPCQSKHREKLVMFTYPKIAVNSVLYFFMIFTSKSKIINILKKIKKEKKNKF